MDIPSLMCVESWDPVFLVFTEHAPKLLYYSHIPTSFAALLLSGFVFRQNKTLASGILLGVSILFALWNFVLPGGRGGIFVVKGFFLFWKLQI